MWPGTPISVACGAVTMPPLPLHSLQLPRRRVLRGGLGAAALAGLGAFSACATESDTTSSGVSAGPETTLIPLFPRDSAYLAAGTASRMTYTFADAEGIPLAEIDGPVSFRVSFDGEQVGDAVVVDVHDAGVPRPYLPLPFEFPTPGVYDVDTEYRGLRLNSQVQVFAPDEVEQPLVGSVLPPTSTPTTEQSFGVDPICTLNPQCPFHTDDLAAVLGTGRPMAVLLASPAYCRTSVCGPILDILIDEAAAFEDLVIIHSEVYRNPKGVTDLSDAELAPLPTDYRMSFEPCLFVTDAQDRLVARGDIVVDRVEMRQLLSMATAA